MKTLSLLLWVTQFGLSILFPPCFFLLLAKLQVSKTAKTILFLEANLTGVYSIVLALALLSAAPRC